MVVLMTCFIENIFGTDNHLMVVLMSSFIEKKFFLNRQPFNGCTNVKFL